MNYYNKEVAEVLSELDTSLEGLSTYAASIRREKYGENKIEEAKKKSSFRRFLDQFNDMMIIILIIVAIVMGIYGFLYSHEYTDTIVIAVVVLLNATMGFIQEAKAEVTLDGLKKYSATNCKVRRDNHIMVIPTEELVPGDIITLEAGDKIAADARIISESSLSVDESPLTGESVPVKKNAKKLVGVLQIQDQFNMLFSGANVTHGTCNAVVTKTGMVTELGRIAVSLNTPYEVETPLQVKIKEISKKLTILIFMLLIFMFFYGLFKGYKFLEIMMLCVSLAVAAIPEGLPAVITITLSGGASALAKKKTVVRQMSAVETLGSTDIICSDKTGTITQNKMSVKEISIRNEKWFNYIAALCNETFFDHDKYIGDPTETCLFDYLDKQKISALQLKEENPRILEVPFDSERKMMSSINTINGKKYILTKGSLDSILLACNKQYKNDKIVSLSESDKKAIIEEEHNFASKALRVIGFAYKELKNEISTTDEALKEESDLVYVGLVGMIDPPREGVKESVQKCLNAGIRPIMITGDSLLTACAIARDVGIINDESEGILGSELDKLSDDELDKEVKKYRVYARVSPDHKRRIVASWQRLGKVVAMTGDGVNDAPAIKDAHVGIGMGITGTEVTKSVADIILLDDSFSTIVVAVEEGRRIFTNIRNNVVYSLSSNFAELFVVLIGMFTGHTILLPIHILFINLVTDSIPSICLSFEKSEKGIMDKKPRGIDKPLFTPFILATVVTSAIIEAIFVLTVYFVSLNFFDQGIAVSLALLSMVLQEIIYAISCRNLKDIIFTQGLFSNKAMNIGIIFLIIVEVLFFFTPLRKILSIAPLATNILGEIILFNIIAFLLYEIVKPLLKKVFKD